MRTVIFTAAAIGALSFASCSAPLLHSIAPEQTLVSDPGLVGEWVSDGGTTTRVVVTQGSGGKYEGALTIHQKSELKAGLGLEIGLTQIAEDRYVDLFLSQPDRERLAGRYGFLVLPVHQFMMIQREGDTLTVWSFDPTWISRAAADNNFSCEVLPVSGSDVAVVTAPSASLRDFLRRHAHDPGALAAPMLFRRAHQPADPSPANTH